MLRHYLALLRGINVGGKVLKMEALRKAMESLPVQNVATYIQSGNLFFSAESGDASFWENRISQCIREVFAMDVTVVVRTKNELEEAIAANPYPTEPDDVNPYYGFFSETPSAEHQAVLAGIDFGHDRYTITGRTMYLMYAEGAGTTKLTSAVIERKLKTPATMRNQKTVRKLVELFPES